MPTRLKKPQALNIGRPKNEDVHDPNDLEIAPPAGQILPKGARVWVEGQVVLQDWDTEGHAEKDKLQTIFRALSFRPLENGLADQNSYMVLREQSLLSNEVPSYRYGRLNSRRYQVDEVHDYLIAHPGLTIAEIAVGLFPDADVPALMHPRIRQYLHRLKQRNLVRQAHNIGQNIRYFPVFRDNIPRDWDARRRVLAYEFQAQWGGRLNDYLPMIQRLEKLLDAQVDRLVNPHAWSHPNDQPF